ncbi:MAG TPA: hypothetical protein VFJ19_09445 [Nocardioidaceae bacterium]|nr:hypothetical protein [Nocardioidaceae bacterium]
MRPEDRRFTGWTAPKANPEAVAYYAEQARRAVAEARQRRLDAEKHDEPQETSEVAS